jgi:hypothetical protein
MFKDTLDLSPVILNGRTSAHPLSLEYRYWWLEERRRCIEGYTVNGVTITGDHYWYLNWWKMRGTDQKTGRKTLISPRFIDIDYEFFWEVERCRKSGKNICVAKRRQIGFSEKIAALIGKEFTLFPHSQSVIAAGEEKYSANTMRMVLRGLNSLKDTEFAQQGVYGIDYTVAKRKEIIDGQTSFSGSFAEIHTRTCRNSDQALVGLSPSLIVFEECGLFGDRLIPNYKYIQPALEANFVKTGLAIFIGTGGEMEKGAEEFEKLFFNPETYDLMEYDNIYEDGYDPLYETKSKIGYFVPAWKFAVIDDQGNSLKAESMAVIDDKRAKAKKSKKVNDWIVTLTQMPLTPDECFMRTGGNGFNIEKLNHRYAELRKMKVKDSWEKGVLNWVKDTKGKVTGVEFVPQDDGWISILERPCLDSTGNIYMNLYKASTDSYDKDEANSSSSKGSFQVIKSFLNASEPYFNTFVARITVRPKTAEEFYEMTAKASVYYQCMNLIEWSNIGIFGWYERNGFSHYLKERPRIAYANTKDSKVNNRYGIDPSTKPFWITSYRDYIEKDIDKMYDEEQILAAIRWRDDPKYNCDITISSSLCIVHMLEDMNVRVKTKEEKKEKFFGYTSKNGQLLQTSLN